MEREEIAMVDDDKPEFRGHIDECLAHFSKVFSGQYAKGSRMAAGAKKPLANFCGVAVDTVSGWFKQPETVPVGERLFKLMCFFDAIGYRVIELERMPAARRNLAELIGYGVLSAEEASTQLKYASKDNLYRVLEKRAGASEEKEQEMWDMFKSRKEELEKSKAQASELLRIYTAAVPQLEEATQKLLVTKSVAKTNGKARFTIVLHLMQALLLILEEVSIRPVAN